MRRNDPFGGVVTTGYKVQPAGEAVTTGYKIQATGEAVTPGYKVQPTANPVSGEYKTGGVNLVPTGDKTGSAQIAMSVGHKNAAADGDESAVSTGYKNVAANADDNASPASAVRMDAFTGTAWTAFAATGRSVMVFFAAGRGVFPVAGCFERLLSDMNRPKKLGGNPICERIFP